MGNCCIKTSPPECLNKNQCNKGPCEGCPDFIIKQHSTMPPFKYEIQDEDGNPVDLTGLVAEASMWTSAKLKRDITAADTTIAFLNDVGYNQVLADDLIIVDRPRDREQMLIVGFNETNKTIEVERGYNGTTPLAYKRCTGLKAFRFINNAASTEMVLDDVPQIDGTVWCDQLLESFLVYNWQARDVCGAGSFCFEFNLLKLASDIVIPSVIPECFIGIGVEWARSYPACGNFCIKICANPVREY